MGLEVLVIAFVFYLMADTITRGKLTAVMRGTVKGTARTAGRAAREGARKAHAEKLAYLDSGRAPLGKTRRRVGKVASGARRAAWEGAVDGVRSELEQLREAIEAAREEAERERADEQQPRNGRFGHSFDVLPDMTNPGSRQAGPEEWQDVTSWPAGATGWPARGAGVRTPDGRTGDITSVERRPDGSARIGIAGSDGRPGFAVLPAPTPYGPDATAPGASTTAPTGQEGQITVSAGTMTGGSGGPSVRVESVPGFIAAVEQLAQLGAQIHESGIALGIGAAAQAGLQDAVDTLRTVAEQVRASYQPLVEAADAVHQDAAAVTVGKARTE
jgi:hypothetical protein